MNKYSPLGLLLVIALTVAPAIYDGTRSFRWGEDEYVKQLVENIDALPTEMSGWKSVAEIKLGESAENMLEPITYVNRSYQKGDRFAQVFVLLGPTGPTAVHTPDVCFSSATNALISKRVSVNVGDSASGQSTLWRSRFKDRRSATGSPFVSSWYGWTTDGTLHADPNPRYSFSDERQLVKVQVTTEYLSQDSMVEDPEFEKFLAVVVREIQTRCSVD